MVLTFLLAHSVWAASLPGVSLPFDVDADGRWTLATELPPPLVEAGAESGWLLTAVDDLVLDDPLMVQRVVALGPSRDVRLRFATEPGEDAPETILVMQRAPLNHAEHVGVLPWPAGFAVPAQSWGEDEAGSPVLTDRGGAQWTLDLASGGLVAGPDALAQARTVPEVFWELSRSEWVVDRVDDVVAQSAADFTSALGVVARARSFQGRSTDHLLSAGPDGLDVYAVTWPTGTPPLPMCAAAVPETCLASGNQILGELRTKKGAVDEALRQLSIACSEGVHRACFLAAALEDPAMAEDSERCASGDLAGCLSAARYRMRSEGDDPSELAVGLLEFTCELESSGTLGERLRRLEDVGAGCMMLAELYDQRAMPDRALLNLDQACVLGRADACELAQERRHQAFAARTIRECEDESNPIAAACVQLGSLLRVEPLTGTDLDEFGAFLRACTLGDGEGCRSLGDFVDRWGIDHQRVVQAETDLQAACKAGEQRACLGSAHLLVRHEPRTEAYAEALRLFDGACKAGLSEACEAGAVQRRIGYAKKLLVPEPLDMWQASCDLNSAGGCAGLADRLDRDRSDLEPAYNAWTRACELGEPHGCSELGVLVERKHDPAWEGEQPSSFYLQRGCDNGDPDGCFWLAEKDLPRSGEPHEVSYLLLDKACGVEHAPGCARLAQVHLDRKTSFDDEIAARHLTTACENGEFDSCRVLGGMYLRAKGVARDRERATELLDRFRLNALRRHLRLGIQAGLLSFFGLEGEFVLPIPVGPALSISGGWSYVPGLGSFMVMLDGEDEPAKAPAVRFAGGNIRIYPNHQGRGIYGSAGLHQVTGVGGSLKSPRTRSGWNAKMGFRSDSRGLYTGIEFGVAQLGLIDIQDFDPDSDPGKFPLILPTFAFSMGAAVL
jgi:uncharacterized protein